MECQQHKQKQDEQQQRKTAVKRVKLPKGTPTASPFTSLSPLSGCTAMSAPYRKGGNEDKPRDPRAGSGAGTALPTRLLHARVLVNSS